MPSQVADVPEGVRYAFEERDEDCAVGSEEWDGGGEE